MHTNPYAPFNITLDNIEIFEYLILCFLCWSTHNFIGDDPEENWISFFANFLITILNLSEKVSHIVYIYLKNKVEWEAGFEPAPRLGKVGLFSIELFSLD